MESRSELVDVKALMARYTVEELCASADAYFRAFEAKEMAHRALLAKPFGSPQEASNLLVRFSNVLMGMNLYPGMTVLDFGSGSCWTSAFLVEMGINVISLDVSKTALNFGRERRARGYFNQDATHDFLHFDGRAIALPDDSVDRILVFDSFHHVPNPEQILGEMSRVLKQGGIVGFCEPGPNHSKSPEAQAEMANYTVIENDIILGDIHQAAMKAGFSTLTVAVASLWPLMTDYKSYLELGTTSSGPLNSEFLTMVAAQLRSNTIFFLAKGKAEIKDSRNAAGLVADIQPVTACLEVVENQDFGIDLDVGNTSESVWLPSGGKQAAVNVGGHVFLANEHGRGQSLRELRSALASEPTLPGNRRRARLAVGGLPVGKYVIEIDLVSELVCWFSWNGSPKAVVNIDVVQK